MTDARGSSVTAPSTILAAPEWRTRAAAHEARVAAWIGPELARRSGGGKHPVMDFLFEYYRFRPARLRRWSPGLDVWMENASGFLRWPRFERRGALVGLPLDGVPPRRREGAAWILRLLERSAARPPMFGCFGMHEWAMVYEADDVRHRDTPLRLPHAEVRAVVESTPLRCSHFDAVRFFSTSARPLNLLRPSAETRGEHEQCGCLHANMDLYKWAFKLAPWIPAELTADCFELAVAAREIDMRASPYDVREFGYEPIPVETPAGRAEYSAAQRGIAERAAPLRTRLIAQLRRFAS